MNQPTRLTIGPWAADRMTGRIERGNERRSLEPKVMDLLFALASEPGRVFTHEELRQRLWPVVTVGDDSLVRCVSKLRKALATGSQPFLETVPKRGYRLVAPVGSRPMSAIVSPGRNAAYLVAAVLAALLAVAMVKLASVASPSADEQRLRALAEADQRAAENRERSR